MSVFAIVKLFPPPEKEKNQVAEVPQTSSFQKGPTVHLFCLQLYSVHP